MQQSRQNLHPSWSCCTHLHDSYKLSELYWLVTEVRHQLMSQLALAWTDIMHNNLEYEVRSRFFYIVH
jgi:hypothetical protein